MRFLVAGAMERARGALLRTMETVAGENPLAFATSRMVIVRFFSLARFTRARLRGHHHPAKAAQIATKRCASRRLFCRDVEGHFRAEPGGLPRSVGNRSEERRVGK